MEIETENAKLIREMILAGKSFAEIKRFARDELDIDGGSEISDCLKYLSEICRTPSESFIGFVLEGYRELYKRSLLIEDLSTAAKCLNGIRDTALKLADFEFDEEEDGGE